MDDNAKPGRIPPLLLLVVDRAQTLLHRISGGKLSNRLVGMDLLQLTTVGRKSGQPRTHTLSYFRDGGDLFVIASNGGALHHPAWYHNLQANPQVTVMLRGKKQPMTARTATPEEWPRLWPQAVKVWRGYAGYRATNRGVRDIPIVILSASPTI